MSKDSDIEDNDSTTDSVSDSVSESTSVSVSESTNVSDSTSGMEDFSDFTLELFGKVIDNYHFSFGFMLLEIILIKGSSGLTCLSIFDKAFFPKLIIIPSKLIRTQSVEVFN